MTPGLGRRKWFWYLRPRPGGMPLALRLSEGLGIAGFSADGLKCAVTGVVFYPPVDVPVVAAPIAGSAVASDLHEIGILASKRDIRFQAKVSDSFFHSLADFNYVLP
jgi:hypothetical protein